MTRIMTVVWVLQGLLFGLMALFYVFAPEAWHAFFHHADIAHMIARHTPLAGDGLLVTATLRLAAPLALAMGLFSWHAAMREELAPRQQLARTFSLVLGVWAFSLLLKLSQPIHKGTELGLFLVVLALAGINAVHGFTPAYRRRERPLSGMANTRPSQLWVLWFVQANCLILTGVAIFYVSHRSSDAGAILWLRERILDHPTHGSFVTEGDLRAGLAAGDLFRDELESLPPFLVGLGLLSVYAMVPSREWIWRLLCVFFAVTFGATLVTAVLIYRPYSMQWKVLPIVALPSLAFCVGNAVFLRSTLGHFTRDVGQGPDGWTTTDLFAGPLLFLRTLLRGGFRASHPAGVGVRGYVEVLPEARYRVAADSARRARRERDPVTAVFPRNDFFVTGRRLPLRARFSNARSTDDAALDARGVALRFSDSAEASPLDLYLATGAFSETPHMVGYFFALLREMFGSERSPIEERQRREAAVAGLRRAPESFAGLRYHSQVVRFWVGADDVRYLVRYRLVPEDPPDEKPLEKGLLAPGDDPFRRKRLPTERRATDYLRTELKRRLETGRPLRMKLQAQFHRPVKGDSSHWYDPSVDWRADDHPWLELAAVVIEATLPDEETEEMFFNPELYPPSLGIPSAWGPWDFRSMADSQRRVVGRVQHLRRWIYAVFGVPHAQNKPGP